MSAEDQTTKDDDEGGKTWQMLTQTVAHVMLDRRVYAAIHLCVPNSGDEQIDAMIHTARRDRFAGQALTGLLASQHHNKAAEKSYEVAADMLVAIAKGTLPC
jgi:hypothetical protein